MSRAGRTGRAAIALLLVSLAACSTSGPKSGLARPYSELKAEELRTLSRSDAARSLEAIAAILSESPSERAADSPSAEELGSIAAEAATTLETEYRKAVSSKDFAVALARLDSLGAINEEENLSAFLPPSAKAAASGWAEGRSAILADEAEDFYSNGLATPALIVFLSSLDTAKGAPEPGVSTETLALWAGRALEARDRRSLGLLGRRLADRSAALPAGAEEFLKSRDSMAEMRSGVVTIRVDKGIRIEQGLGIPDGELGTGFFIDRAGYVLTNYHVIKSEVDPEYEGYSHMSVRPADAPETRIGAKVVGYDRLLDLALIKVERVPKYVFSLSEGAELAPGDKIFAIGSPAGLADTVTSGIVSAVGRRELQVGDIMQVDAAINPGNSGGPLLDEAGAAVGVVFAGMPQFQSLNFAIPSYWILKVLPGLFKGGELKRSWLGISLAAKESGPAGEGIELTYRHPSVAAGLEEGDRLLEIGGERPKDIASAQALLLRRAPGGLIRVRVARAGAERVELRYLAERPFSPLDSALKLDRQDRVFPALFGMSLTPLPGSFFESSNYSVTKVWPGSAADESGLSENDPISLKRFYVDKERRAVFANIYVKKRKAGFLESILQIPASLETPDFL